jgi:hypothetical protein
LLDEVSQGQVTKREPLDHARSILKRIDPVRIAIKKIRNKVVAHQDDRLSQPQVYAAAKLNLPALTEISVTVHTLPFQIQIGTFGGV